MTQAEILDLLAEWGELTYQEMAYLMRCHVNQAGNMCRRLRFYGEVEVFEEAYRKPGHAGKLYRHVCFLPRHE